LRAGDGTAVTETVYRQQLRPIMEEGATTMDAIFPINRDGQSREGLLRHAPATYSYKSITEEDDQ